GRGVDRGVGRGVAEGEAAIGRLELGVAEGTTRAGPSLGSTRAAPGEEVLGDGAGHRPTPTNGIGPGAPLPPSASRTARITGRERTSVISICAQPSRNPLDQRPR